MNFRSDLALECMDINQKLPGVHCHEDDHGEFRLTRLHVQNEQGARALGKPVGHYVTVELPPLGDYADVYGAAMHCIAEELHRLLPKQGTVLVAGLGNHSMTPDALGPLCCQQVLATRHIAAELAKSAGLGKLRPVSTLTPGVLGRTGMESSELIAAAVQALQPAAVIAADALAARSLSRLGCTVQMSNAGIVPGSGVGNARQQICESALGVPVIALGVPTVVDAATLVSELSDCQPNDAQRCKTMMVTPREIDLLVQRAAKLCSMAINRALQPHLSVEDFLALVE
ncbi:MAG: GPR endopeptidase [Oscillospiraceae bacterium]|nr:GPR endopeptidase [Oscillospiraceae bacterium]